MISFVKSSIEAIDVVELPFFTTTSFNKIESSSPNKGRKSYVGSLDSGEDIVSEFEIAFKMGLSAMTPILSVSSLAHINLPVMVPAEVRK